MDIKVMKYKDNGVYLILGVNSLVGIFDISQGETSQDYSI